ncbi:MAG: HlyD family type I secretion periplasmic adaptor subunit [Alphaproteobacteria bacterium]
MNRLDGLLAGSERSPLRLSGWVIMGLIGGFFIWSAFARLDEVAVATGQVIPQAQLKVIQHLEGGIVSELYVEEGSIVQPGEILLRLDLGSFGRSTEDVQIQIDGLELARARLKAEISGDEPTFGDIVTTRRPELVDAERGTYRARLNELQSSRSVVLEQIRQRELEIRELEARQRAVEANLRLAREKMRMSQELLKSGLTPRMEHLELERELESLSGEGKVLEQTVPRAQAALAEAQARLTEVTEQFRRRAVEELSNTERQLARLREEAVRTSDQAGRTEIRSPVQGAVKNLRFNTIGGVVKAGEPIMEIVPEGDNLVIEARLNPVDRGYVEVGQKAVVKISTYDFVRYGGLNGEVTRIGATTNTDSNSGQAYYTVIVTTNKTYLGQQRGELPISPGMQATVDIHTGARSVLSYLIKSVLKLKHEAFRER